MAKGLLAGVIAAAIAGAIIGIINKYVGGPAWLVGGVAGCAGALVCGMTVKASKGNPQR